MLENILTAVRNCELTQRVGSVSQIYGLVIESKGPDAFLGEECHIFNKHRNISIKAEVVGLKQGKVLLMPYGDIHGISLGCDVIATGEAVSVPVGNELLGRVVDAFGQPMDDKGEIVSECEYPLYNQPENPLKRTRIKEIMETGVKVIDTCLTLGRGQRMGIFSGSGVGKSTLLGMISRYSDADVIVIALVGERGREVLDFIENSLGTDGLKRSVLVVATSDQPALMRLHAALAATSIAEYFRNQGKQVLLMMDSLTRYAMAMREIGLSVGEPPTSRGYTPSVFANLPKLLERGGTSSNGGSITAIYTVLVEGDDINDPISDSVRAILDGHIILSRNLSNRDQYPPIDILSSKSRLLSDLANTEELKLIRKVISNLNLYEESRDMIDIGAYQVGHNPLLDKAIQLHPKLNEFFNQIIDEHLQRSESMDKLRMILNETS